MGVLVWECVYQCMGLISGEYLLPHVCCLWLRGSGWCSASVVPLNGELLPPNHPHTALRCIPHHLFDSVLPTGVSSVLLVVQLDCP